ncbi:putative UDP-arabinose 4-epimerase [Helianthus annuus]|uniref:Putative NAD(P)-binding domain-containing protein n=1 Tax=Helianthus annuus TaxID=4232 RepID=A0A251S205_HELAN|nr:putative UDP-arabinose 4-epimerase [Helianthus annuus]KAJ0439322.1 putative UDP-arabinose 4-epimerase [Helianthus annuus]KAJ0461673.1 putative UDP-arabinose 4-epimerase [Helianthus annuus]KAJ0645966.1 putative UDP-arabinose 4-epimerase [Helianthus annuus]KAJ0822570.1 putative UDP-arabinose 4-epimerase [Helianthus annuus]
MEDALMALEVLSQYYIKYPGILEAMATHNANTPFCSSTCATFGEPEKMPITVETPQVPWAYIYFNVIGSQIQI